MRFGSETKGRCGFSHLFLANPTFTCVCAAGCLNSVSKDKVRRQNVPWAVILPPLLKYLSVFINQ